MINSVLDYKKINNSQLQTNCVLLLDRLFIRNTIINFTINNYFFEGVRGDFDKLSNYCICFDFSYFDYSIEFYLSYDQLEYYIIKNN